MAEIWHIAEQDAGFCYGSIPRLRRSQGQILRKSSGSLSAVLTALTVSAVGCFCKMCSSVCQPVVRGTLFVGKSKLILPSHMLTPVFCSADFFPEDGGDKFLRDVDLHTDYTALYLRRWQHNYRCEDLKSYKLFYQLLRLSFSD
jgi:hypothetical protein